MLAVGITDDCTGADLHSCHDDAPSDFRALSDLHIGHEHRIRYPRILRHADIGEQHAVFHHAFDHAALIDISPAKLRLPADEMRHRGDVFGVDLP